MNSHVCRPFTLTLEMLCHWELLCQLLVVLFRKIFHTKELKFLPNSVRKRRRFFCSCCVNKQKTECNAICFRRPSSSDFSSLRPRQNASILDSFLNFEPFHQTIPVITSIICTIMKHIRKVLATMEHQCKFGTIWNSSTSEAHKPSEAVKKTRRISQHHTSRVFFGSRKMFYVSLLTTLLMASTGDAERPADDSPIENVTAVMESKAMLPCDISTTREDDKPVLIMFYRNDSGTPIYTVDLREVRRSNAKHTPYSTLQDRSSFDLKRSKSGLRFNTVWSTDDGLYRCRVDFKTSPTRNSWIYLSVIVPPDSVRIVDQTETEKSATIGPYVLGQTLTLKCIAKGGRPAPKLTWWGGSEELRGTQVFGPDGQPTSTMNTLTVPSLQRHHLHQSFACNAANSELAVPITAAVIVDMTLPPLNISLAGIDGPVSANVPIEILCRVIGARPTPKITFFLDGRELQPDRHREYDDGNITDSSISFTPSANDQGSVFGCRGETPGLLEGKLETFKKLDVHYVPVVSISLNTRLNRHRIHEGDDVYFTCSISASPPQTTAQWYHNGVHLHPNSSRSSSMSATGGVRFSNVSLLVTSVGRQSKGEYVCKANNSEGTGSSAPYYLDVKYRPICKTAQRWHYGVALGERAKIMCEVDANPGHDVEFTWTFNKTGEVKRLLDSSIVNNGTVSELSYTPLSSADYGLLICQSKNIIGRQSEPCFYTVFLAGPPDPVYNCTVTNEGLDSVRVQCMKGENGGLQQSFVMEVYETRGNKLKSNLTQTSPSFIVRGLQSGLRLTIKLYAANDKGRSQEVVLRAITHGDAAEKQTSLLEASELPSTMELYPSLPIILGVIGGIVVVFSLFIVVMLARRPSRSGGKNSLNQEDSRIHILKKDDSTGGRQEGDERDPDVIPESRGSRTDCGDEQHPAAVADVSTLYGEMMTQQGTGGGNNAPANNSNSCNPSVSSHQDNSNRPIPVTNAHIHLSNTNQNHAAQSIHPHHHQHHHHPNQQQFQVSQQPQPQQHIVHANIPGTVVGMHGGNPVHLTMSVQPMSSQHHSHIISPTVMSHHTMVATSPSSRASPLPQNFQQIPPNTSSFQPNPNAANELFFQNLAAKEDLHQGQAQTRLQHTQSLQHDHQLNQHQQKLAHQQSLPERNFFNVSSGSAVAYANAHLLTSKSNAVPSTISPVAHIAHNPLNNHPHHQHFHEANNRNVQHHNNHNPNQKLSSHHHQDKKIGQQQQQGQSSGGHHHHHKPKNQHSGSRSSLVGNMGPGSTQTLPHPRSQQTRSNHATVNINTATLGRRSSLYIDPLSTPIAPPASYASTAPTPQYVSNNTPTTSPPVSLVEVDNGGGVLEVVNGGIVPVVAETVCITPNYTHHHPPPVSAGHRPCKSPSNPPDDHQHQQQQQAQANAGTPSSFGTGPDRMESSV